MPKATKQAASKKKLAKAPARAAAKPAKKVHKAKKPAVAKKVLKKVVAKASKPAAAAKPKRATKAKAPKAPAVAAKAKPVRQAAPKVKSAKPVTRPAPAPVKVAVKSAKTPTKALTVEVAARPRTVAKKPAAVQKAPDKVAAAPAKKVRRAVPTTPPSPQALARSIDTSLAAEVAANMVLNHLVPAPDAVASKAFPAAQKRETSTFKHMKEAVANPPSHHLDGLFGVLATTKRPQLPFNRFGPGPAQSIDKDFGLDVKRTHLPRRKAG